MNARIARRSTQRDGSDGTSLARLGRADSSVVAGELRQTISAAADALLRVAHVLRDYDLHTEVQVKSEMLAPVEHDDQWLSLRDVAARLGLGYGTVRQLVESGTLPATRIPSGRGRRNIRRISLAQLDAYLAEHSGRHHPDR